MASFYICRPHQPTSPPQSQHVNVTDAASACRVLRKAAIKLHEVPAKLEISKVIRFLENLPVQCQKQPGSFRKNRQKLSSQVSQELITFKQVQNEDYVPPSVLHIATTRSLTSSSQLNEVDLNNSIYKKLGNREQQQQKIGTPTHSNKENCSGLMQNFQWRQVVTKNALDQSQNNRRVRFKNDSSLREIHDNEKAKDFQLLKEQNYRLKQYILNVFKFFQTKQLIQLPSTYDDLQLEKIESISKDLFGILEKREVELEFQRKKMMEVHSQYLQTLKNISIDQRLEASQLTPKQTSIVHRVMGDPVPPPQNLKLSNRVKQLVTASSKAEQTKKQMQSLSQKLKQMQQQIQKYQMFLFIKQQQISSLRVLNSDLQNRLNKLSRTEQRPRSTRSKSYKKYFEQLDQNMSASVS